MRRIDAVIVLFFPAIDYIIAANVRPPVSRWVSLKQGGYMRKILPVAVLLLCVFALPRTRRLIRTSRFRLVVPYRRAR